MSSDHGGGGGLPGLSAINNWLHSSHEKGGYHFQVKPFAIAFTLMIGIFFFVDPQQTIWNFEFLLFFSPLWVPALLYRPTLVRYIDAVRYQNFSKRDWVLLELRMPRETNKTPFAMETFISNLHIGSGETNWYKKYINGGTRPWFSFEIVSLEGRVHFYIWTTEGYRRLVETYIYAQYPGVEVIEAEDYSRLVDPAEHGWNMWGCEYTKNQPSPIPIKTYMEYNLTPGIKPEENVDPLAQLIEFMGSFGPGEQFWLQFVIRMTKTEKYEPRLNKKGKPFTWRDECAEVVKGLRTKVNPETHAEEDIGLINLTDATKNTINGAERNVGKQGFDVGIRAIYCAKEEKFNGISIPAMLNMFKPFNNEGLNTIGPQGVWHAMFGDYPWEDPHQHHFHHISRIITDLYRQRTYFYYPYKGNWSIFSSEELATLFHVPTSGVTTPNLPRTQSTTAAPPSNLPT